MGILDKLLKKNAPEPDATFVGLRAQALGCPPPERAPTHALYGIVMETGRSAGAATLVCLSDGSVSLYLSSGGGIIGAGGQESVRAACLKMFEWAGPYASDFLAASEHVESHPLPRNRQVFFYLLSADGVYLARCKENDLVAQRDPFSNLLPRL